MHGYLTVHGEKISKSGRTIDPTPLIARYGADALRYFLLRHVRTARDGDFSIARFVQAHDAELANGLGNLASRVLALAEKVTGGRVPAPGVEPAEDARLREAALALRSEVDAAVAAWLPGSEGAGVADVLTGAVAPGGHLPVSWGDLPVGFGLTY